MGLISTALRFVRFSAFIGVFFNVLLVLLACFPLALLNAPLRVLGVRESRLPVNMVFRLSARLLLFVGGIRLVVRDPTGAASLSAAVFMYNHSSNLDPVIVMAVAAAKFIYKRELAWVPLFGWVLYIYNHVAIDRKDRESAIESLNRAVRSVVRKQQCVAISPEGTRSKTGELLEFKKGPFHLAKQAGATIVPVVIQGAFPLLPPRRKTFGFGTVTVTLLPPLAPGVDESVDALQQRVRGVVVDALASPKAPARETRSALVASLPALAFWIASAACVSVLF